MIIDSDDYNNDDDDDDDDDDIVKPGPTSDIEVQALDIKPPTLGQDTQGPSCNVMLKITKIILSMLIMVYTMIINCGKDMITTLWIITPTK